MKTKRLLIALCADALLGLRRIVYKIMVAAAYIRRDRILFDTQWWPENSTSQFLSGPDNSAHIVTTTTKDMVKMDA